VEALRHQSVVRAAAPLSSDGLGVSRSGSLLGSLYQMYSPWCRYRFHLRFNGLRVPMVGMHRD
jgi:hypothetical protein